MKLATCARRFIRRRPGTLMLVFYLMMTMTTPSALAASQRIATLDWTLAETLQALGTPPAAAAQIEAYHDWVGKPRLPDSVIDLGLRTQPNLELLADLNPDQIMISPMFANLTSRLSRIAPVKNFSLYSPDKDTWTEMRQLTRGVAKAVDRPEAAEKLIKDTEARIETLKQTLPDNIAPLLTVQFMDARHVRVFGDNGLYQAVLKRLGIDNAWHGETNAWGFSLVGLEELADLDARLVVVEPYPAGVRAALEDSGLWQGLKHHSRGEPLVLRPVWSFGALPSAQRFAEKLSAALEASHAR